MFSELRMSKKLKELVCRELEEHYRDLESCVLVDYQGVDGRTMTGVRAQLRERNVSMRVVKNSLAVLALRNVGKGSVAEMLDGPCALMTSATDPVELVKAVADAAREIEALEIKGGLIEGERLDGGQIVQLSKIPSRDVLNAQIAGVFAAPMVQLAGVLQAIARAMAYGFAAYRDKLAESEEGSGEGE